MNELNVESTLISFSDLQEKFSSLDPAIAAVRVPVITHNVRSPELIASIFVAGATAIGTVIRGIFEVAKIKAAAKIIVKTSDGTNIEAPAFISEQELSRLLRKAQKLDVKSIQIH